MSCCKVRASRNLMNSGGCGIKAEKAVRGFGIEYSGAGVAVFESNIASAVVACCCASGDGVATADRFIYGRGSRAERFWKAEA